jgi:hypothetical protein
MVHRMAIYEALAPNWTQTFGGEAACRMKREVAEMMGVTERTSLFESIGHHSDRGRHQYNTMDCRPAVAMRKALSALHSVIQSGSFW